MEKYTIDALKAMICKELDESVTRGIKSREDLEVVKDLTESFKNLEKIEKYKKEQEEIEMGMRGYSQRRNNYAQGNSYYYDDMYNYMRGNSNTNNNRINRGNSDNFDPMMMRNRRYSRANKEEAIQELHKIAENATDEKIKDMVFDCISNMERMV